MRAIVRFFPIVVLLVFLNMGVNAQPTSGAEGGSLKGRVTDVAGNALVQRAFLLLRHSGSHGITTVTPGKDSQIDEVLEPGLYDVFITADGFTPLCKKLLITKGQTTTFDVKLKPDSEHLQSALKR
ncbi:MAG: carboxypeptidase-like regulatory domain-containing protein [Edaphobacter sp.]